MTAQESQYALQLESLLAKGKAQHKIDLATLETVPLASRALTDTEAGALQRALDYERLQHKARAQRKSNPLYL